MKKSAHSFVLFGISLWLYSATAHAGIIRAIQTGDWESSSTWLAGNLPANGDSIIIPAGKSIRVTTVADYSGGAAMKMNIFGDLTFQTGKKLTLPAGSEIVLQVAAYIIPGNGGGNSNMINVGNNNVWYAGQGSLTGYLVLPNTPLPVDMLSFTVVAANGVVQLRWTTATEVNNHYFEIQKSLDGVYFTGIGKVDGHGSSATGFDYRFDDSHPAEGNNYYRLKQVDYDGKFEITRMILCVYETRDSEWLVVYPNPTNGPITMCLFTKKANQEVDVSLSDSKGNVILKRKFITTPVQKSHRLTDGSVELKPGIYYLTAFLNDEPIRKQVMVY